MSTAVSPPPFKRPKLQVAEQDHQQSEDEENEENEEEEMTFTACQILCGNLDNSLLGKEDDGDDDGDEEENDEEKEEESLLVSKRAQAVLDLFGSSLELDKTSSDIIDWTWSLESVKHRIRAWEKLYGNNPASEEQRKKLLQSLMMEEDKSTQNLKLPPLWKLVQPAIVSNAHVLLANHGMDQVLSTTGNVTCSEEQQQQNSLFEEETHIIHHLKKALEIWPCNPSALLTLANLERMGITTKSQRNNSNSNTSSKQKLQQALELYLAAAKCAWVTQQTSFQLLEGGDDSTGTTTPCVCSNDDDKFLVETILLELSAQFISEEEEEDSDTDTDNENKNISKALVIASYMAAMLASTLGKHDLAKRVLRLFGSPDSPMTRIHPAVWQAAMEEQPTKSSCHTTSTAVVTTAATQARFEPCGFPNAIPRNLLDVLRFAFRPDAPYWKQSQYDRNVYYSFWTDWPLPQPKHDNNNNNNSDNSQQYIVSNAIEHVIVTCLLPRLSAVKGVDLSTLKGFEWWVHTRPVGANLGHQLHFDTDEALLDQDSVLDVPISASVTYLTLDDDDDDDDDGDDKKMNSHHHHHHKPGATILFDQTPQSKENAQVVWISQPKSKAFVAFPGDLLHGVLPCVLSDTDAKSTKDNHDDDKVLLPPSHPHRLTFMVNFWATRIPDRIKERKLYGPSGPFPPRTAEHSWVEDIIGTEGQYPRTVDLPGESIAPSQEYADIIRVSPAWETLTINEDDDDDDTHSAAIDTEWKVPCHSLKTTLGEGIHQRFFVKNAPDFFRRTLYEKCT